MELTRIIANSCIACTSCDLGAHYHGINSCDST
jgi:hypothetical protein